ncbi:hypothetical protein MESMUL_20710 [Mesosutterella multiformis]|uniref:Uncharacterized protein n=1 Tax=Mesosutterella multiformis TaxID=2259133 RepID=A0A388SEC6_9BURK|nr:hypothetical protein MESMUL_20710 [Mesosutterella multiformis]GCB31166.1 hypothetical protein KGMB02707_04350 [Mesosutterella multiformis]
MTLGAASAGADTKAAEAAAANAAVSAVRFIKLSPYFWVAEESFFSSERPSPDALKDRGFSALQQWQSD